MMTGQGDRSGKKPKYRIRDIGGVELNSEDKPTERVLNFLMRGEGPEMPPVTPPTAPVVPESRAIPPAIEPEPPRQKSQESEPHPRRSLDSLFERAGATVSGSFERPTIDRRGELASSAEAAEIIPSLPPKVPSPQPPAERSFSRQARATAKPAPQPVPDDLAAVLEEIKNKRRLNKGELKVLTALVIACRAAGSDSCYIKIAQLMNDAQLKERHTQMMLRSLQELGLIERVAEYSNLDRRGTQFRVRFDDF
jgi:hypothetical protein